MDAFANTDLDLLLRKHGIHQLIVIGLIPHTCIEATVRSATELGYQVTVVKDATADYSDKEMHAALEINIPNYRGPRATVFSRFWAPTMADDPPLPLPTAVFTKQSARTAEAGGQPGRPSNKVNCLVDRRGAPRCSFNLSIADGLKRYAFSVIAALLIRLEPRVNRKKDASPRI